MAEPTQEELQNMSQEEILALQKKNCIFCKMVTGEIPTYKIYSDDKCFAILDINPANEGHILLLPQEHYSIFPQVPANIIEHLMVITKKISKMLLTTLKVKGTSILCQIGEAAGQKAPHVMIHIIPAYEEKDLLKFKLITQDSVKFHELLKLLRTKIGYNPSAQQKVAVDKVKSPSVIIENKEEKEKVIQNFEDPKKIAKVGIEKEKGYLYYVDKEGDISRAEMARGRKISAKTKLIKKTKSIQLFDHSNKLNKPEKVKKEIIKQEVKKDKKCIDLDSIGKLFN